MEEYVNIKTNAWCSINSQKKFKLMATYSFSEEENSIEILRNVTANHRQVGIKLK
jgi:hypothetical protein